MHGLYLIWWVQERGIPAPLVASILAAGDLALAALEVPTGWLADRFGHRASLIAGSLVQILGMLLCWFGHDVPSLVAASVLVALGDGFRSGADQALLYRTCQALGSAHTFQRIEGTVHAVQQAALVALVLAGGVIVELWGFAAGWAAETLLCSAGLALACAMIEPPPSNDVDDTGATTSAAAFITPTLVLLILPGAIVGGAASAGAFLAQTTGTGDAATVTVLVAMMTAAEAAGSLAATRLPAMNAGGQLVLLAAGVALCAAGLLVPATFPLIVVALFFVVGMAVPLRAAAVQRLAAEHMRARGASVASALDVICSVIAVPGAAFFRGRRA